MTWTALLTTLAIGQNMPVPDVDNSKIEFTNGFFSVTAKGKTTKVNSKVWPARQPTEFDITVNKIRLQWSWKGLTITANKKARTTNFVDFPTSAKFFSPGEVRETTRLIETKRRRKEVSALSGWEVQGNSVFLLLRWEDSSKQGWVEGLARLDCTGANPWPEMLAVFNPVSFATTAVDDELFSIKGGLACVSVRDGEWGFSKWYSGQPLANFSAVGNGLASFTLTPGGDSIKFLETTPWKTRLVGTVNMLTGVREDLAESRDPITFAGDAADVVMISRKSETLIRNVQNGLELKLPADVGVKSIDQGVLVWVPYENPRGAVLYGLDDLRARARWSAPRPTTNSLSKPNNTKPKR